jgi:Redoxin
MSAWGKSLDADKSSGIRFLGDPDGSFTRALDVEFNSAPILGNNRSKRYALVVKDGKITEANIEPDNTGLSGESITPKLWTFQKSVLMSASQSLVPTRSLDKRNFLPETESRCDSNQ